MIWPVTVFDGRQTKVFRCAWLCGPLTSLDPDCQNRRQRSRRAPDCAARCRKCPDCFDAVKVTQPLARTVYLCHRCCSMRAARSLGVRAVLLPVGLDETGLTQVQETREKRQTRPFQPALSSTRANELMTAGCGLQTLDRTANRQRGEGARLPAGRHQRLQALLLNQPSACAAQHFIQEGAPDHAASGRCSRRSSLAPRGARC